MKTVEKNISTLVEHLVRKDYIVSFQNEKKMMILFPFVGGDGRCGVIGLPEKVILDGKPDWEKVIPIINSSDLKIRATRKRDLLDRSALLFNKAKEVQYHGNFIPVIETHLSQGDIVSIEEEDELRMIFQFGSSVEVISLDNRQYDWKKICSKKFKEPCIRVLKKEGLLSESALLFNPMVARLMWVDQVWADDYYDMFFPKL